MRRLKALLIMLCWPVLLIGCNAAQVTKAEGVILQLQTNTQHVLVVGCANAPSVQVLVAMVLEFIPEGTDKASLTRGITIANANVAALCAKVQTPEALAIPDPITRPIPDNQLNSPAVGP